MSFEPRVAQQGRFLNEPCNVCATKTHLAVILSTAYSRTACICFACLRIINSGAATLIRDGKIQYGKNPEEV